jgi:hypothetical protein
MKMSMNMSQVRVTKQHGRDRAGRQPVDVGVEIELEVDEGHPDQVGGAIAEAVSDFFDDGELVG